MAILIIKHAHFDTSTQLVTHVFNSIFHQIIVSKVNMFSHLDHKTFAIFFDTTNELLDAFIIHIDNFKVHHVYYDLEFFRTHLVWHVTRILHPKLY